MATVLLVWELVSGHFDGDIVTLDKKLRQTNWSQSQAVTGESATFW